MILSAVLTVAISGPAAAATAVVNQSVLDQARRVADWQLAHMDDFAYVSTFRDHTEDPIDWIQATFWAGLTDLADVTGDDRYADAISRHGEAAGWGFGERPRHADADAIGHAWVWAAGKVEGAERERRLSPIRARFDAVLAAPSDVAMIFDEGRGERACQVRWCWSDAVFMAPPVWAALSKLTGAPAYWRHADHELTATIDALYDQDDHLFYRDSRFVGRPGASGRKVFWSRGNGWSYAGLAKVIEVLPADDPSRARYIATFQAMSERLRGLQGSEGYWPVSLLDPGGPPETSGTGFFVYGMAWGVNHGVLDADTYGPTIQSGWAALDRAVQPDGRLGWVQQVGYAPDQVAAADTQLYGVGALLMAASEVSQRSDW
ncbi:MAG: glycoside hydrolase family 88 protein [Pseudomonadota bacterium]